MFQGLDMVLKYSTKQCKTILLPLLSLPDLLGLILKMTKAGIILTCIMNAKTVEKDSHIQYLSFNIGLYINLEWNVHYVKLLQFSLENTPLSDIYRQFTNRVLMKPKMNGGT